MNRKTKSLFQRSFFHFHRFMARRGVVILPNNCYSAIPAARDLEQSRHLWQRRSTLPGIKCDIDDQINAVRRICAPYQQEFAGNKTFLEATQRASGPGFGYIEAQALHGFIRHYKPRRIIEVGSGVSTRCALAALALNQAETGASAEMTSIEPEPYPWLRETREVTLVHKKVQEAPLELFAALGARDLLFIDSSHSVKTGADVNFLVLEVLPRLGPGVLVHFHDIYLPFDFPPDILSTITYGGGENSLVRAFLTNNDHARIIFCLSMLHYDRPDVLKEVFPEYEPRASDNGLFDMNCAAYAPLPGHFPSSLYLEIR